MNQLKALWASLPHPVQCLIVAFATAAGTTFLHAFEQNMCFSVLCLKHYVASSLLAGLAAARAFYMVPNRPAPSVLPPDVPKAA